MVWSIGNNTDIEVHQNPVPGPNLLCRLLTFQNGQADVDGIPIEDSGEALGDDAAGTAGLDDQRGVLPGRAAAEVPARHHHISGLYLTDILRVDILHAVLGKLLGIGGIQVPGGDDHIRIHIVRVFVNGSFGLHISSPPWGR